DRKKICTSVTETAIGNTPHIGKILIFGNLGAEPVLICIPCIGIQGMCEPNTNFYGSKVDISSWKQTAIEFPSTIVTWMARWYSAKSLNWYRGLPIYYI